MVTCCAPWAGRGSTCQPYSCLINLVQHPRVSLHLRPPSQRLPGRLRADAPQCPRGVPTHQRLLVVQPDRQRHYGASVAAEPGSFTHGVCKARGSTKSRWYAALSLLLVAREDVVRSHIEREELFWCSRSSPPRFTGSTSTPGCGGRLRRHSTRSSTTCCACGRACRQSVGPRPWSCHAPTDTLQN